MLPFSLVCLGIIVASSTKVIALGQQPWPAMFIQDSANTAVFEWAASRQCSYTESAVGFVSKSVQTARPNLEIKRARYNLNREQSAMVVTAAVAAYLDDVTTQAFGPERTNCVVDLAILRPTVFSASRYLDPDAGYLTVDGKRKGAAIAIDGERKGNITMTFVVSAGWHHWQTMKCDDKIYVKADDTTKVFCDKQ